MSTVRGSECDLDITVGKNQHKLGLLGIYPDAFSSASIYYFYYYTSICWSKKIRSSEIFIGLLWLSGLSSL